MNLPKNAYFDSLWPNGFAISATGPPRKVCARSEIKCVDDLPNAGPANPGRFDHCVDARLTQARSTDIRPPEPWVV